MSFFTVPSKADKHFAKGTRQHAVARVDLDGDPIADVAADYERSEKTIRRWRSELLAEVLVAEAKRNPTLVSITATSSRTSAVDSLVDKLPAFDASWDASTQARWWDCFAALTTSIAGSAR